MSVVVIAEAVWIFHSLFLSAVIIDIKYVLQQNKSGESTRHTRDFGFPEKCL